MKTVKAIFLVFFVAISLVTAGCSEQQNKQNTNSTTVQQNQQAKKQDAQELTSKVVFLPTDDARGVKAKSVEVVAEKATPKGVIETLLEREKSNPYSVFPKELVVEDVTVKDGIAYVSFNKAFLKPVSGGTLTEELEIASLVNTLTENKSIKSVLFLVDGAPVTKLSGHLDMSEPLKRMDNKIVK